MGKKLKLPKGVTSISSLHRRFDVAAKVVREDAPQATETESPAAVASPSDAPAKRSAATARAPERPKKGRAR